MLMCAYTPASMFMYINNRTTSFLTTNATNGNELTDQPPSPVSLYRKMTHCWRDVKHEANKPMPIYRIRPPPKNLSMEPKISSCPNLFVFISRVRLFLSSCSKQKRLGPLPLFLMKAAVPLQLKIRDEWIKLNYMLSVDWCITLIFINDNVDVTYYYLFKFHCTMTVSLFL